MRNLSFEYYLHHIALFDTVYQMTFAMRGNTKPFAEGFAEGP